MNMQRRHFEFIAEAMRDTRPHNPAEYPRWREIVGTFAMRLARTNGQFQRDKFLRACGVED